MRTHRSKLTVRPSRRLAVAEVRGIIRHISQEKLPLWEGLKHAYKHAKSQSLIMDLLLIGFVPIILLWLIVIADPLKNSIVVHDMYMDYQGKPLFLTQLVTFERVYFIINGIQCLLFVLRILQIAKVTAAHPPVRHVYGQPEACCEAMSILISELVATSA
jgi:hypothetical protein